MNELFVNFSLEQPQRKVKHVLVFFKSATSMSLVQSTQRVPVNVFLSEIERLEGNIDRSQKGIFLHSIIAPDRHLSKNST